MSRNYIQWQRRAGAGVDRIPNKANSQENAGPILKNHKKQDHKKNKLATNERNLPVRKPNCGGDLIGYLIKPNSQGSAGTSKASTITRQNIFHKTKRNKYKYNASISNEECLTVAGSLLGRDQSHTKSNASWN